MGYMKNDVLKVLFDVLCFFIFAIPLWVYNLVEKAVPLNIIGFFCGDRSIHYPYRNSSISSTVMFVSGCGMLVLAVLIVETLLYKRQKQVPKDTYFHPLVCNIYRAIGYCIIGACINQFLTDIGKLSIGRLRPHFLEMCEPTVQCNTTTPYIFIENYQCTRTSHPLIPQSTFHKRMADASICWLRYVPAVQLLQEDRRQRAYCWKSMPSGHASFSFYMAVFIVLYIEYRMTSQRTRLVRHLVQTGIMAWAVWICCSRIFDYKHRYSDVSAGIILGTAIAFCMMQLFWMSSRKPAYSTSATSNGFIHEPESSRNDRSVAPAVGESTLSVLKEDV